MDSVLMQMVVDSSRDAYAAVCEASAELGKVEFGDWAGPAAQAALEALSEGQIQAEALRESAVQSAYYSWEGDELWVH